VKAKKTLIENYLDVFAEIQRILSAPGIFIHRSSVSLVLVQTDASESFSSVKIKSGGLVG
jgi:hypothetical protein